MKTRSKALLLSLCAILLVASTVFGTLAYLTDTENVVNTFTVGNVYITLDEAKVNDMGKPMSGETVVDNRENADRLTGVEEGKDGTNAYHLLPGHTYTKDPTLTVLKNSEEAYVRLLVKVNDMTKLTKAFPKNAEDENDPDNAFYAADGIFLLQNLVDINLTNWEYEKYTAEDNVGTYEFRYKSTVAKNTADDTKLNPLFTQLTVPGYITNANLAELQGITITVEGHAIQADGFTTDDAAWTAFDGQADKASTPPAAPEETPEAGA